jgi:glycosyltransferase involved in cell wall biosynthesis
MSATRRVEDSRFAIVANGFAEGPAQALREFLLERGARRVTTILHPLVREGDTRHVISEEEPGVPPRIRRVSLPARPPLTYPLDLVVPLRSPSADGWFGFNSLACARGLWSRRRGRVGTVVYWCVDFVPDRFGSGPLTAAYDALDRLCCRRADARFELSRAALEGREDRHGIPKEELAPARVVPMGAWLDRVPTTPPAGHEARTIVFLGHLVPRQGVQLLVEAMAVLPDVKAEIIGRGPLEEDLRRAAARLGLGERVHFHGFVEDHREVERILAKASVAAAPYEPDPDSFSRFADPGKLKAYLAAGLPILLTDVPPNAQELAERGGAEIVPFSADGLAQAARRLLDSPEAWQSRRQAALLFARDFDWPAIFRPALESIGFVTH